MSAPHEVGGPRESLVRAEFAPDNRRAAPDDPARLALVVDNHDSVNRQIRIELSGPLADFTGRRRPRPRMDLPPGRQREIILAVRPEETRPEGGYSYDLHAVVIDEKLGEVVFTCTARVFVERFPQVTCRPEPSVPYEVTESRVVQLRVRVRNSGNVPLLVDAQKVSSQLWVRDKDRRREVRKRLVSRQVRAERAAPGRTPKQLQPLQRRYFDVLVETPPYLIGTGPRRWWVPVGIHGDDVDTECVFTDFVQRPRIEVEARMLWLVVAVGLALLVLVIFMVVLAS